MVWSKIYNLYFCVVIPIEGYTPHLPSTDNGKQCQNQNTHTNIHRSSYFVSFLTETRGWHTEEPLSAPVHDSSKLGVLWRQLGPPISADRLPAAPGPGPIAAYVSSFVAWNKLHVIFSIIPHLFSISDPLLYPSWPKHIDIECP